MSIESQRIDKERENDFGSDELKTILYGGADRLRRWEQVRALVESNAEFDNSTRIWQSRTERYVSALRKVKALVSLLESDDAKELIRNDEEVRWVFQHLDETLPIDVHVGMFVPTIEFQGTDEQVRRWAPLARSLKITGAYAQTELGHGSSVRNLETTATLDKHADEWVIHSPTVTSTKWWPGGLGLTANYCVCHAQMIVDGRRHGVHPFIVPLRSERDHTPLPGRTLGDIGPKFGFASIDNGFARFDKVRVPRDALLMRFTQVARDGAVTTKDAELAKKLTYSTMLRIRSYLVAGGARVLSRAVTVAVRYSTVRVQGQTVDGSGHGEMAVVDYRAQQAVLFPQLATCYALHFTGAAMLQRYHALMAELDSGSYTSLPEVHALSSGLKSYVTSTVARGVEQCRLSLGGHGYADTGALTLVYGNYVSTVTLEGTAELMAQQCSRFLLKNCQRAANVGSLDYAAELAAIAARRSALPSLASGVAAAADFDELVDTFRSRVAMLAARTRQLMLDDHARGITPAQSWVKSQVALLALSRAHSEYYIVSTFVDALRVGAVARASRPVRDRLAALAELYALHRIEQSLGEFRHNDLLSSSQANYVAARIDALYDQVRAHCVPLVDAFNHSDELLQSALGCYDGDYANRLFARVQDAPLNQSRVPIGYREHLRPILKRSKFQACL
jgi:acyl-CoA oxidase